MKKSVLFLLTALMVLGVMVFAAEAASGENIVGILTGTVSQGEEEFRAAEKMAAKFPGKVITATYPDNFTSEVETTIARAVELASNGAKAIVFVQAVPGAAAAIEKVHETYPDVVFVAGVPGEDPDVIASKADIVFSADEIAMGTAMVDQAYKMGAKKFVHYSFARHMSYATIVARHELMKEQCAKLGMEFIDATAPDPTGDAGVSGAQQFILEDLPRKVEELGKDTAFFNTNCGMQEAMIQAILKTGAYYPQQCCPSPYHAYPGALGIEIPEDKQGDVAFVIEAITKKIEEKGGKGHFSTWPVPVNMMMVEAGTLYAFDYLDGKVDSMADVDHWTKLMTEIAGGSNVNLRPLTLDGVTYDNYLTILADYINF